LANRDLLEPRSPTGGCTWSIKMWPIDAQVDRRPLKRWTRRTK